ncbi:3312_t:CDS:2, partial [Cetraspora pellucida]
ETCQRATSSRLIDCSFELYGKKKDGQWNLTIKNADHNYEASEDMSDHPSSRRLNAEEQQIVQQMSASVTKVSVFALKKVHEQFLKVFYVTTENPLQPCTYIFTSLIGLPCSHKIQEYLTNNQYLQLADFHEHWWLQRHQLLSQIPTVTEDLLQQHWQKYSQQFNSWLAHQQSAALDEMSGLFQELAIVVQNLQVQQTRECLLGARNIQSSTQRDPFTFELTKTGRHIRKCGLCHLTGHNSRTCSNNREQN